MSEAVAVSAQAVAQLREKTGIGFLQCKKALAETGGDMEKAIEYLRKQGVAVAAKRSGKETKEGKIVLKVGEKAVAAVEINCETDFVASSDDFNAFANGFSNTAQGMMLLSFSRGSPTALRRS